jgi:hypothetical protein
MLGRHTVSTLRALAATAFASVAGAAAGQAPELPIESIDVYGSSALDSAAIRAEFAADIELYVATMNRMRAPNANFDEIVKTLSRVRDKLTAALNERVPLAYVEISGLAVLVQDRSEVVLVNLIGNVRLDLFAQYMIDLGVDVPRIEIDPKTLQARIEASDQYGFAIGRSSAG